MKHLILLASLALAIATPAFASGTHSGGHSTDGTEMMPIGHPGKATDVKRTVTITMMETKEGKMLFEPARLTVLEGQTIRLKFVNRGESDHEFVMDTQDAIIEHKALMEKFPEMEHADPNSLRLTSGGKGEIIWTFARGGDFGFACLIPGHYEAGMKGTIKVNN